MRLSKALLALLVLSSLSPLTSSERGAPEVQAEAPLPGEASKTPASSEPATRATAAFGALPTRFEENRGQAVEGVRYVVKSRGLGAALTDEGLTLALPGNDPGELVRLRVVGGRSVTPRAEERRETRSSYFFGQDPNRWVRDAPSFGRVVYPSVRDGVDLVFHGEHGQLEYDFVLAPRASVQSLEVEVSGAQGISLTEDGSLSITTPSATFVQRKPRVFQRGADGHPVDVGARYVLREGGRFAFEMSTYDAERELVIDPVLEFSTYLGGAANDRANAVAADNSGVYVAGFGMHGYPLRTDVGGPNGSAFVAKLNLTGTSLLFDAVVGGAEDALALAVDASGSVYVGGSTGGDTLPLVNAFQSAQGDFVDAFLVKLSPAGNDLQYSTYFGGQGDERISGITVDQTGHAYVVGSTSSRDLPIHNAVRSSAEVSEAFVAKFSPNGSTLDYATYLGGEDNEEGRAIAVDSGGHAYVVGWTLSERFPRVTPLPLPPFRSSAGFLTKLSPSGSSIVYSTYLGGGYGLSSVAVDASGSAFVAGNMGVDASLVTKAFTGYPGTTFGVAVAKVAPNGQSLAYCDVIDANAASIRLAVDARGSAVVTGQVGGTFPMQNPILSNPGGGYTDGFIFKLSPDGGDLQFSSYLGGPGIEQALGVALDSSGAAYVVGRAFVNLPTLRAVQPTFGGIEDGFLAKVVPPPYLVPAMSTAPRGRLNLAATSGSGTGYVYSFGKNVSGGTVDAATGAYVAGARPSVVDEVVVTDSNGNTAVTRITVGPGVSLVPASPTLLPRTKLTFRAAGGSGEGYVFSLSQNGSGATLVPPAGTYVAGDASFAVDTLTVTDSLGNTGSTSITVSRLGADAGEMIGDAGVVDGGVSDAGEERDAGDGGGGAQDAGVDAGPSAVDAGPVSVDAGEPNGTMSGGGCDCRTGAGGGGGLAAGVMVAVVGLVVGRRRRG